MGAKFGLKTADANGASKLNDIDSVPATAATEMTVVGRIDWNPWLRQLTDVTDDHDADVHSWSACATVVVKSIETKLSPDTVIERPPERGTFSSENDPTGASKEYDCI